MAATLAILPALLAAGNSPVGEEHHAASAACSRMFDPYKVRIAVLRSCGDQVYPLRSVTTLPGGGKAYSYPGAGLTFTMPPAHFDPLRASDRHLSEYGFPTRRQLGAGWYGVVRHMQHVVSPPPYLVALTGVRAGLGRLRQALNSATGRPCDNGTSDTCWGGYIVQNHHYTEVDTRCFEPDFTTSSCNITAMIQWAGMGGFGTNKLGQDGTMFNVPNGGAHQAFTAKVSQGDPGNLVPVNLYATPDYEFFAQVTWDPGNSRYDFTVVNEHTNASVNVHSSPVSGHDGSTADAQAL